jgi:malate synthase
MHGPEEVAFADETVLRRVEEVLGLPRNTVKLGIMDEERRTTVNLKECIRAAKHRVAFINTGFLDRTGDEIHTSMEAGPISPQGRHDQAKSWITAYENQNVDIGLECGLPAMRRSARACGPCPTLMAAMLEQKIGTRGRRQLRLGAVAHRRDAACDCTTTRSTWPRCRKSWRGRAAAPMSTASWTSRWRLPALDAEADPARGGQQRQGILGYVVRWVDQGVGCSKVPDINDVG